MFVSVLRHTKVAAAAAALQTLLALVAGAEPRPINEPEREAVAIVAAFLSRGPAAIEERLAPDAPLRALPREDALAELAVRTGPRDGARWTLQTAVGGAGDVAFRVTFPSGYEDGLLFRMTRTGDRWSPREVLTLAENPALRATASSPASSPRRLPPRTILMIAAVLLGILAAIIFARSRALAVIALLFAAIAAAAAILFPRFTRIPEASVPAFAELRSLLPLREALARGDDPTVPLGVSAAAREVGMLWILESGATITVRGNASDPLAGLTTVSRTPLAEVVRARLALGSGKGPEVGAAAFTRALAIKPQRDDILVEAATSFGVQPASTTFLDDPRFDQSRDPRLHYARALRAAASDEAAAQRHLRTAWTLKPMAREELVREPRLLPLLRDVRTISMISYYGAEEPLQRSPSLAKTPIPLPPDAQALVCGNFLRIQIAGAAIDVPGGATLAPPNARIVPATYWRRQDDEAALRDAKTLLEQPARSRSGGGQLRLVRAVQALADHNRWPELLALTNDITPQNSIVPPSLITLRIWALLRADRDADARALANGAAVEELMARGTFPGTLLAIGDAIASRGSRGTDHSSWDISERLYRTIKTPEQQTIVAARLRQLELRRTLATNGVTIATQHFDVRHDPSMNPAIAGRIGELLEAELARIRKTLTGDSLEPRRVTVNVFYWDDFREGITGGDHILGVYDGEILFPFGVVNQFKPEIVAVITHELTHAVVAQATADNAPRWFQEGLAQRMELVPRQENAFHETATNLVLPVPLLDAVMENATDLDAMENGYRVAQTFIRYLESRYGDKAIRTLMASFAAGKNTEDAIAALTGKSLDAVNRDFRDWGFANSATFVNTEPWPYGDLYSPGVDPRIKAGFKWSRRQ
jgi:Peptidase MA superfamily